VHKKILAIVILALAAFYCVQGSNLMCGEPASQSGRLADVPGKVNSGDTGALDRLYDGTVQNKKRAINLSGGDIYGGGMVDGRMLQGQFPVIDGTEPPPNISTPTDSNNQAGNPEFNEVGRECVWLFWCTEKTGIKYEAVPGALYVAGQDDSSNIVPNDVNQGQAGDCYFLSSLAAVARKRPDMIRSMIRQNPDGTYSVDFYRKRIFGNPKYVKETVTVDNQFPVNQHGPAFAGYGDHAGDGNQELWVMVMEKAYAKFRGSYNAIGNGGWPGPAMESLTGKGSYSQLAAFTSLAQIAEWDRKGYAVTASSLPMFINKKEVVKGHVYHLLNVDLVKKTITMGNPWGHGNVTLTEAEFKRNFSDVAFNPVPFRKIDIVPGMAPDGVMPV